MSPATAQAINAATGYRDGGQPNDNQTQTVSLRDAYNRPTVAGLKAGDYQHYRIGDRNVQLAWSAASEAFYVSVGEPGRPTVVPFTNLKSARTYFADACRKARNAYPGKSGEWLH